ncbi:MAG TPA: hypothetical protein VFY18_11880, partial [Candidatus Limnocylindrales bacterium]|nr:hypothetical protein [Candidatus Limnocylindrales bacterium]
VLPSDFAWRVIIWSTAAAITLIGVFALWAVLVLVRRRRVALGILRGILVAAGFALGFLILATNDDPAIRFAVLILGVAFVVAVAWTRPRTGGAVLVAMAMPWTIWWVSFLLDNAFAARQWVLADVLPALGAGVVAEVLGAALFIAGGQAEQTRNVPTPSAPVDRKFGATAYAILGPTIFGSSSYDLAGGIVLLVSGVVTASLAHGRPFLEGMAIVAVGVLLAWAATCMTWVLVRRPANRRGWEAYAWLGEWELDRYRALAGGPAVPSRNDFRRWLKASQARPDLAWIRAELFVMEGQFEEALAAAESIPDDTPYGRVEREGALASVDWHSGGPAGTAALRTAVDEMPETGEDHFRAEVVLAASEIRRLLAAGDPDPIRPILEVRDRLGALADGILWTVIRRRLWSKSLLVSLIVVVGVVGLDRLLGLG